MSNFLKIFALFLILFALFYENVLLAEPQTKSQAQLMKENKPYVNQYIDQNANLSPEQKTKMKDIMNSGMNTYIETSEKNIPLLENIRAKEKNKKSAGDSFINYDYSCSSKYGIQKEVISGNLKI